MRSVPHAVIWRSSVDADYFATHISFNQWFRENSQKVTPTIDLLDTTETALEESCERVADWIRAKLGQAGNP